MAGVLGRRLEEEAVRIGLEDDLSVRVPNFELVERAFADAGNENLPHAGRAERCASDDTRPSQLLKSPTTLTRCAFGAQTAKLVPGTPSMVRSCAPSLS